MENNSLLNVDEAAEFLKIKKSSVYQMTMKKALPLIRIGRLIRFSKTDLDEFIRQRKEDAVDAPLKLPTL